MFCIRMVSLPGDYVLDEYKLVTSDKNIYRMNPEVTSLEMNLH